MVYAIKRNEQENKRNGNKHDGEDEIAGAGA